MNTLRLVAQSIILVLFSVAFSVHAQSGSLDLSFDPGTGTGSGTTIYSTALLTSGDVVIGGWFTTYNGMACNYIARLNPDGSLDTDFNSGTGANNAVKTTTIQSDGRIIIGGGFTSFNGVLRSCIARLNPDGSLDMSFDPGAGVQTQVGGISASVVQPDGKILIGGVFGVYDGMVRHNIARLNPDGSLDPSFDSGTLANGDVWTIALQPDGKVLIGGAFTDFDGTTYNRIARLNPDGSLDGSFNPGSGPNSYVSTISVLMDGKVLVGGSFTSFSGTACNRIARLNADGSLDMSFLSGSGASGPVYATALQSDGKIIIGGGFTNIDGVGRNRIARLNADGTLDSGFNPGSGALGTVRTTTLQPDGKIVLGGEFAVYDGVSRSRVARINGDAEIGLPESYGSGFSVFPNPTRGQFNIALGQQLNLEEIALFNMVGSRIRIYDPKENTQFRVDITGLPSGFYLVRFTTQEGSFNRLVILEPN